jgi:hypothetical protein
MRMNETKSTPVVVRQASCDHMTCRDTPCGCPVPNHRLKLDLLVGADLSCLPPIYRPLVLFFYSFVHFHQCAHASNVARMSFIFF